jgi:biotin carboxylase
MARVLLLLATRTYRARAFLDAASRLKVAVTVGTDRRQALAPTNPAGNLTLSFSDPTAAAREIATFHALHPIDAVVAADDDGAELAAEASAVLGLAHHSAAAVRTARSKRLSRERWREAGLPGPGFVRGSARDDPDALAARVRFPCVVKPVDLSASRGVIRADDHASFVAAFRRTAALLEHLRPRAADGDLALEMIVEDFVPGPEVALEGLVDHGRLRVLALFDKPDPLDGPFFEETIYVTPSRLAPERQDRIAEIAARAIAALGLDHGPVHAELRVPPAGPVLLEIAPRSIGGLCSLALRFGDDESLETLILRHALGYDVSGIGRERAASGVMMIPIPRAGVLRGVGGVEAARAVRGVSGVRITVPAGDELVPLPEGHRYLGFIFARGERPEEVERTLRDAHEQLRFEIAPPAGGREGVHA